MLRLAAESTLTQVKHLHRPKFGVCEFGLDCGALVLGLFDGFIVDGGVGAASLTFGLDCLTTLADLAFLVLYPLT